MADPFPIYTSLRGPQNYNIFHFALVLLYVVLSFLALVSPSWELVLESASGCFPFIRDAFNFPKQFKHWLRSTRMGLFSRLGGGHFEGFPNLIGTLCFEHHF